MSWTKEEYDKKLHAMRKYYYDENGEWREYLGNGPIAHNLQSAVYYYKDGFDSEIITSPEFDEDYIRLEASGGIYGPNWGIKNDGQAYFSNVSITGSSSINFGGNTWSTGGITFSSGSLGGNSVSSRRIQFWYRKFIW